MAIGREDTNGIYDRVVSGTLRREGVTPVFMGRLQHNDDVDDRIIREIQNCDFAIADLTYARPSVYFEAGFAQRSVPVIYTCRRDHLKPRADDGFGNFRVHFDLQMKNIIAWSGRQDREFAKTLLRRVRLVAGPLLRAKEARLAEIREERDFQRISLNTRLQIICRAIGRRLRRCGYLPIMQREERSRWAGSRLRGRVFGVALAWVRPNFTQKDLQTYVEYAGSLIKSRLENADGDDYAWQLKWSNYKKPKPDELKSVIQFEGLLVLCALERVPRGRVDAALPSFAKTQDVDTYVGQGLQLIGPTQSSRTLPMSITIRVLDDIRSQRAAELKASRLFAAHG